MKKKYVVLFILISVISISLILFIMNKISEKEEFEWKAKYIWLNSNEFKKSDFVEGVELGKIITKFDKIFTNENIEFIEDNENSVRISSAGNTWACFRKKVYIENKEDIQNVIAKIAVDSKYWLYINDEMVVREGQLKRGQKPDSTYYDEVNLDSYLNEGENTISILVWYFGKSSYSHKNSKQGVLLFQAQIGDELIISDDSWKAIKNPSYLKDVPVNNDRLSESNIYYDSNLAIDDWYKSNYDDSSWEYAKIYGEVGNEKWGELIARDIPQFKNSEIKEYENFEQYREYLTKKDELLKLKLPYNTQLTPYLKIEAEAGQKIIITTDENYEEEGKAQKCTYITKDGIQEFESLAWINGDNIYYYIPEGIKIISLGYRETGYDTEFAGSFKSNDEFFNKLWNMAQRTLYINMRDSYMDCPDRERAQWWGDASVSMEQAMYALDTNANYLYEKGVKTIIEWQEQDILMTIVPQCTLHLPVQMLLGITSMYDYYEYTGDKEFLEYVYPNMKEYLELWSIKENGLVELTNSYMLWPWADSAGDCDYVAVENAWYYYALVRLHDMAEILNYEEDITELKQKIDVIYSGYNKELWKESGYKTDNQEKFDVRANAVAILSGLASQDKYDDICKMLIENQDNSTLMEKYVLEALCKLDKIEEVQERIKLRYNDMVMAEDYSSTLWEYWEQGAGSKNHAWSGGPLTIMSKYFAGIQPLKPGYDEISITPKFGYLNSIEAEVETVKGKVSLNASKDKDIISLEVDVPTKTLVAIEKSSEKPCITVNNKTIYKDGKGKFNFVAKYAFENEEYVFFYINEGNYKFKSK